MKGEEKRKVRGKNSKLKICVPNVKKGYQDIEVKMKKMHSPLLDCSVQISSWTKLHDFTPVLILILYQINRLHDIGMMQRRWDTELSS